MLTPKSTQVACHLRARELAAYAADLVRPLDPRATRAVIFAQGRTGSTLLEGLLCSTGHFSENGEILNCHTREIWAPLSFTLGEAKRRGPANFLFHVKIYQLTRDRRRPIDVACFLRGLHHRGWRIIYLHRSDVARHVLSTFVAGARGSYHKLEADDRRLRFAVDPDAFERIYLERRAFRDQELAALAGLPHFDVNYESDLESAEGHQPLVDRLLDWLGLERRPASARTRRINVYPPEELVENYRELVDRLRARELSP
jgi:LPS sulfotransferase NodH